MADINILYARRDSITRQLQQVRFEIQSTEQTLTRRQQEVTQLETDLSRGRLEDPAILSAIRSTIRSLNQRLQALTVQETQLAAELVQVNREISVAQQVAAAPRQSAADTVREAQRARDDGASPTNPPPPALVIEINGTAQPQRNDEVTNAQQTPTSGVPGSGQDSGLDAPVKKIGQTQATPSTLPQPGPPPPNTQGITAAQNAGVAAAGDDVRASLNALFGGEDAEIITQPNVLDKYANYTYSISLYLMSPEDYARLIRTKQKNLAGYNLLIQSAGIPVSTGFGSTPGVADVGEVPGVTTFSLDQGRNEFFQEDFYIDDLRVISRVSGKGTAGPHNVTELDFRIIEPNGITLLPRIYKAVQKYVGGGAGTGELNYAAQNYLMVIRFYGYDAQGNQYVPIKGVRYDRVGNPIGTPQAIEKFIPFQFTSLKFRVADKITEYQCEAVCPMNLVATGPARGTIPYNVEITSKTLQELFNGPIAFSSGSRAGVTAPADTGEIPGVTVPNRSATDPGEIPGVTVNPAQTATTNRAPAKASSASTPTITQGLAAALNQFQEDLVNQGIYNIPDRYQILVETPALQNAKVVPPGQTNQRSVPMGPGPKAPANQQKNPATQSQNKDAKNTSALAGMSIIQFIDQYTRTSTYIYDQQLETRDPKTQQSRENATPPQVVGWYRVGIETVPRTSAGYDRQRNDYAYDITYQISPYKVNDLQSNDFPKPRFQGTHKKYNYWFTGENTQILKFEQDFNYLYYLTINSKDNQTVNAATQTSDYREYVKKFFSPRSAQSSMGQQGPTNEASANAADYLYSPADQGRISLEIVGDPSWLQQGELWGGVAGAGQLYGPFLEDGTINFEGQEILFEIAFNQPVDYNLDTGVMDPTTNNYNKTDTSAGSARQSYVYRAIDVTNKFSRGQFTQELNGVLVLFDLTEQQRAQTESGQRDPSTLPNETENETRRLQRLSNTAASRTFPVDPRTAVPPRPAEPLAAQIWDSRYSTGWNPDGSSRQQASAPLPALPAQPPTSSGQPVGPATGETPGVTAPVTSQPPQTIAREP